MKSLRSILVSMFVVSISGLPSSADQSDMTFQDAVLVAASNSTGYSPMLRDAQATFARCGLNTGPVDGAWGPLTAREIARVLEAARTEVYYVMEQAATLDGRVQVAVLLPIHPNEVLLLSEEMVDLPYIEGEVPSYFTGESESRYFLFPVAPEVDQFHISSADHQNGYRTIVIDQAVPLVKVG